MGGGGGGGGVQANKAVYVSCKKTTPKQFTVLPKASIQVYLIENGDLGGSKLLIQFLNLIGRSSDE